MRVIVAPMMVMLLALLHAPPQAQALLFDLLPSNLVQLGSSEPVTLALTGLTLLSLARLSTPGVRDASERAARPVPADAVRAVAASETLPTSVKPAA
jgi:hypothetical protein